MKRIVLIMTVSAALTACSNSMASLQEKAERTATEFAEAYFNYDLTKASTLVTPESVKWISFVASNISEEDIEVLNTRSEGATVTLDDCEMINDTTCEAVITVDNFMAIDTIGRPGVFRHDGTFRLTVVLRDGRWLIKMASLPQNETRSHD